MKAAIRSLNNNFVAVVLVILYFVIIGTIRIIYKLSLVGKKKLRGISYLEKLPKVMYNEEYFSSPY